MAFKYTGISSIIWRVSLHSSSILVYYTFNILFWHVYTILDIKHEKNKMVMVIFRQLRWWSSKSLSVLEILCPTSARTHHTISPVYNAAAPALIQWFIKSVHLKMHCQKRILIVKPILTILALGSYLTV